MHLLIPSLSSVISLPFSIIFRVVLLFRCNSGWKLIHLLFFHFKDMDYFNKKLQRGVQEINKGHGKPEMWGAVSSSFVHLGGSWPLGASDQGLKQPPASGREPEPELHSSLTSLSISYISNRRGQCKGCPSAKQQFCRPWGETMTSLPGGHYYWFNGKNIGSDLQGLTFSFPQCQECLSSLALYSRLLQFSCSHPFYVMLKSVAWWPGIAQTKAKEDVTSLFFNSHLVSFLDFSPCALAFLLLLSVFLSYSPCPAVPVPCR